jgi:hypothetical protein
MMEIIPHIIKHEPDVAQRSDSYLRANDSFGPEVRSMFVLDPEFSSMSSEMRLMPISASGEYASLDGFESTADTSR